MQQKALLQMAAAVALVLVASLTFLRQKNSTDPTLPQDVAQALAMVEDKGCPACHSRDGAAGVGPTWQGSWGSVRHLSDGSSVVFDGVYLRQSVADPAAKLVLGFQNLMLPVPLSEAEFQQLEVLLRYLAPPGVE
jgi:cytochrome c oxidase subunit 2